MVAVSELAVREAQGLVELAPRLVAVKWHISFEEGQRRLGDKSPAERRALVARLKIDTEGRNKSRSRLPTVNKKVSARTRRRHRRMQQELKSPLPAVTPLVPQLLPKYQQRCGNKTKGCLLYSNGWRYKVGTYAVFRLWRNDNNEPMKDDPRRACRRCHNVRVALGFYPSKAPTKSRDPKTGLMLSLKEKYRNCR